MTILSKEELAMLLQKDNDRRSFGVNLPKEIERRNTIDDRRIKNMKQSPNGEKRRHDD